MDEFNFEDVRIAAPCKSSWAKMKGDDRVRFCSQCSLNVYNVSEMTQEEAEKLITETEGRLCIRLWRRRDGTIITKDCPMALKKLRYGYAVFSAGMIGTFIAFLGMCGFNVTRQEQELAEGRYERNYDKNYENSYERSNPIEAMGRICYAKTKLYKGHKIQYGDFTEIDVEQSRVPANSILSESMVIGVYLNCDISEGRILNYYDLCNFPQVRACDKPTEIELNLHSDDMHYLNLLAQKQKTSVSKIIRSWIHEKLAGK